MRYLELRVEFDVGDYVASKNGDQIREFAAAFGNAEIIAEGEVLDENDPKPSREARGAM